MKTYSPQGLTPLLVTGFMLVSVSSAAAPVAAASDQKTISLQQAISLTLQKNPQLAAYPFYLRQADADKLQADIRPIPKMNISADNILGTGKKSDFDEAEITLSFSQTIELGNKRQSRYDYANSRQQQLQLEYDISRLDILAETSRRYYQLLALQAKGELLSQRIKRERQALTVIKQRARAGAVAQADVANMALRLANSEAQQHHNDSEQQTARLRLSHMWLAKADFAEAAGSLAQLPLLPDQSELKARLDNGINGSRDSQILPDFRYQLAMQRLADNQLQLAQANGRSDITLNAGIRQLEASGDQAFTFGLSMPLAFENPNRGRIARAQIAQQLSQQQTEIKRQQLSLALNDIQQQLNANLEHLDHIENKQIPLAQQLLKSSRQAYGQGRYSVLQWIDAQNQYFKLQLLLTDTRLAVFNQILELERVLGQPLTTQAKVTDTNKTPAAHSFNTVFSSAENKI